MAGTADIIPIGQRRKSRPKDPLRARVSPSHPSVASPTPHAVSRHVHTPSAPPSVCEDHDAWELVRPAPRVSWCGRMLLAPAIWETGQLFGHKDAGARSFRCYDATCKRCGFTRVANKLREMPKVWSEDATYYLAYPVGSDWPEHKENAVAALRANGHPVEYLTIRRRDPYTNNTSVLIWASSPIRDLPVENWTDAYPHGWQTHDFASAFRTLRDQMCVPFLGVRVLHGDKTSPPISASAGWQVPRRAFVKPEHPSFTIDGDAFLNNYEAECRREEMRTGINPMSENPKALQDPDYFWGRLVESGIIKAMKKPTS